MRTAVHITGTTSGLGEAIAKLLCQSPEVFVFGYARSNPSFEAPNYKHIVVDLSKEGSEQFMELDPSAHREILINNAGWIGPIAPIGSRQFMGIQKLWMTNTIAVFGWTNRFASESKAATKTVISISSGAAKNAIPSWSNYCASKSAIEMATKVWNLDRPDISFLAIAPGVVDTSMQLEIRSARKEDFPLHQKFVKYHTEGELKSPQEVAQVLAQFALNPSQAPSEVFSVRDL